MQDELFSLSLNDEGAQELARFNKRARMVFVGSLLLTAVNFILVVSRINDIFRVFRYTSRGMSVQLIVSLVYLIFTVVIVPVQWYTYLTFSRALQSSIAGRDNHKFNRSFSLLNSHAAICLMVIIANMLYFAYIYYGSWVAKGRL